jgi:hypothetical protein
MVKAGMIATLFDARIVVATCDAENRQVGPTSDTIPGWGLVHGFDARDADGVTVWVASSEVESHIDALQLVKRHAYEHYEQGWDIVVECCDDAEIVEAIGNATTREGAIRNVAEALYLEAHTDQLNDALAAGGLPTHEYKLGL